MSHCQGGGASPWQRDRDGAADLEESYTIDAVQFDVLSRLGRTRPSFPTFGWKARGGCGRRSPAWRLKRSEAQNRVTRSHPAHNIIVPK